MAKLLKCGHCHGIIHLTYKAKQCDCGAVGGATVGPEIFTTWGKGTMIEVNLEALNNLDDRPVLAYITRRGLIQTDNKEDVHIG